MSLVSALLKLFGPGNISITTHSVAGLQLRYTATVVRVGILGIEPDGLVEVSDGLFVIFLAAVCVAAAVVREGIFGIEPDGLVVVSDSAVEIALDVVR